MGFLVLSIAHNVRLSTALRLTTLALAVGLAGCATTFNHAVQTVIVTPRLQGDSAPTGTPQPGASQVGYVRVLVTTGLGTYRASLPSQLDLPADTWFHARIQVVEPCFKPTEQGLPRSITYWIWGDALGLAVTAGAAGAFAFVGDGLDGTMWKYDREATVRVEPVADYAACIAVARLRPGEPFPISPDPVWVDPRDYSKAMK